MPEPLHIFLGDLHAGSSVAVMEPFTSSNTTTKGPGPVSALLLTYWKRALKEAKALAVGHSVVLHLGGDLIDGDRHHGTKQTEGTTKDQVQLAAALLLPWVNMSDKAYALLGTDAHVGDSGEEDRSVAQELGIHNADHRHRLNCAGKLLDWAHHTGLSRADWTQENAPTRMANKILIENWRRDGQTPDLIVRHHVHRYVRVHVKGTDVFTCPGWQAQTSHTRKLDPAELLAVGVVLWFPKTGEIKPIIIDWPDDEIRKVAYPR